ncbi:Helicase required for RNAi-mediated heterochromatin assembly 1 [Podosphaera aphanis]|nr:Helicase required for RNAi-mediated heterochromatin assembly 1 [Podosphaera aphanis]
MHPLAGTKRGGAFATQETEDQELVQPFQYLNSLSKARRILNAYYQTKESIDGLSQTESWRNLPEIPSCEEILSTSNLSECNSASEEWNEYQNDPVYKPGLPSNIIDGPWPSKEAYITAHYRILREDAIASLRNAVQRFKHNPRMQEDESVYIYTEVTITGWLLSKLGPACRVEFCTDRTDKRIRWEQSKRLTQGTVLALSSYNDMFHTSCKIAIVGGRLIEGGLDQNPPTIDLFFGDLENIELDPHDKFIMIEARDGYFEASRHMLVAMQKLMCEKFPLSKHLAYLDSTIEAPEYLKDQPKLNLSSLLESYNEENSKNSVSEKKNSKLLNINVLEDFPKVIDSGMDESQMQALQSIITKSVAIVQGPPGTGKTFVSISSLKIMAQNLSPDDPPIIVAAQTNHALDQLLNHILEFEPGIVRLGGQSARSNEKIRERTIYNLRAANYFPGSNEGMGKYRRELKALEFQIRVILAPLLTENLLTSEQLLEYKIITEEQRNSLLTTSWATDEVFGGDIASWLGDDQKMPIKRASTTNLDIPLEEIEADQWREPNDVEQDFGDPHEADYGALNGEWIPYRRKYTGRHLDPVGTKKWKKRLSKTKDLYEIQENERGLVYRYFEVRVDFLMRKNFKAALKKYDVLVNEIRIAKAICNIKLLDHLGIKIVGCTTSGLSKYRGFLSALQPRTILIEEAAETSEGKIIAGIPESIQQIIMVGDHKQLQASCTIPALREAPYYMNVSMFERLVKNEFPYIMLNKQRRMISDIRKLLCIGPTPFYDKLHDHEVVLDRINARPPVPGMGGKDTYFFNHNWPEARNPEGSCYNEDEAEMIVGFFHYLHLNGVEPSKITVLTFYNGQRKLLLRLLKCHIGLLNINHFNVQTVDSYQGEENDIILLSLVRSNKPRSVGFLDNKNRFVVALSRARRGLYIFGNSITLTDNESEEPLQGRELLWLPLLQFMRSQARFDINTGLPVTCSRHKTITFINEAKDFAQLAGGCNRKCDRGLLPCHHVCPLNCHSFDHQTVTCCKEPCSKSLVCGHRCSGTCSAECFCDTCGSEFLLQIEAGATHTDMELSFYNGSKDFRDDVFEDKNSRLDHESTDVQTTQTNIWNFKNKKSFSTEKVQKKDSSSSWEGIDPKFILSKHNTFPTTNKSWNKWDASITDQKLSKKKENECFTNPKSIETPILFDEIFKRITVQDGERYVQNVERVLPQRFPEIHINTREYQSLGTRILNLETQLPMNLKEIEQRDQILPNSPKLFETKLIEFDDDKHFPGFHTDECIEDTCSETLIDLTEPMDLIEL